jgi:PTS system N-acetylglucosamine-specific IIC component
MTGSAGSRDSTPSPDAASHASPPLESDSAVPTRLLAALGGRGNVRSVVPVAGRALIGVAEASALEEAELRKLVPRGIARTSGGVQLLLGASSVSVSAALQRLLAAQGSQRA